MQQGLGSLPPASSSFLQPGHAASSSIFPSRSASSHVSLSGSPSPLPPQSPVSAAATRSSHSSSSAASCRGVGSGPTPSFRGPAASSSRPPHHLSQHQQQPVTAVSSGTHAAAAAAPLPPPPPPPPPPQDASHLPPPPIGGEDVSAIVIDLGSTLLRVGHAQEDCPRQVLPACALAPTLEAAAVADGSLCGVVPDATPTQRQSSSSSLETHTKGQVLQQQRERKTVRPPRLPGKTQQYCGNVLNCCCCRQKSAAARRRQQQHQRTAARGAGATAAAGSAGVDDLGGSYTAAVTPHIEERRAAAAGGLSGCDPHAETAAVMTEQSLPEETAAAAATINETRSCCCCACRLVQSKKQALLVPVDLYDYQKACRYTFRRCLSYHRPLRGTALDADADAAAAAATAKRVAAAVRAAGVQYGHRGSNALHTTSVVSHHLPGPPRPPLAAAADSLLLQSTSMSNSSSSSKGGWRFDVDVFKALLFRAVQGTAVPRALLRTGARDTSLQIAAESSSSVGGAAAASSSCCCTCCCGSFAEPSSHAASFSWPEGTQQQQQQQQEQLPNSSKSVGPATSPISRDVPSVAAVKTLSAAATADRTAAADRAAAAADITAASLEGGEAGGGAFPEPFRSSAAGGLGVYLDEHPLLLVEPTVHDAAWREETAELIFKELRVPAAAWAKRGAVAAFAFGRSTALVVHVGAAGTTVGPVYEGFCLQRNTRFYPVGGDFLDLQIARYIRRLRLLQQQVDCCSSTKIETQKREETKEKGEANEQQQQQVLEEQEQETHESGRRSCTDSPCAAAAAGRVFPAAGGGGGSAAAAGSAAAERDERRIDDEEEEGFGGLVLPTFGYRAVLQPRGVDQQQDEEEESSSRRSSPRENRFLQQLQQQQLRGSSACSGEERGGAGIGRRLLPLVGWKVLRREPLLHQEQQQNDSSSKKNYRVGCFSKAMLRAGTQEAIRVLKESVCRVLLPAEEDEEEEEEASEVQQLQNESSNRSGCSSSRGDGVAAGGSRRAVGQGKAKSSSQQQQQRGCGAAAADEEASEQKEEEEEAAAAVKGQRRSVRNNSSEQTLQQTQAVAETPHSLTAAAEGMTNGRLQENAGRQQVEAHSETCAATAAKTQQHFDGVWQKTAAGGDSSSSRAAQEEEEEKQTANGATADPLSKANNTSRSSRTSSGGAGGMGRSCCCSAAARTRASTAGKGRAAAAATCCCYELPDGILLNTEPLQYTVGEILFRPAAALQQLKLFARAQAQGTAAAEIKGGTALPMMGTAEQQHASLSPREAHALGGFEGITKAIEACIESCDVDIRRELLSSIIVTGGTSLMPERNAFSVSVLDRYFQRVVSEVHCCSTCVHLSLESNSSGFVQRVAAELQSPHFAYSSAPCFRLRIIAPNSSVERRFSSWLGGSLLASLGTFQQQWISREEYMQYGIDIVNKRCY